LNPELFPISSET